MKNNVKLILATAADWVTRNGNRRSLITFTRAEYSSDGKKMYILYTVLPESQENQAEEFLTRHCDDIRNHVKIKMKTQPAWFRFKLDTGEHNRQRVTDLLDDTAETHGSIPEILHK